MIILKPLIIDSTGWLEAVWVEQTQEPDRVVPAIDEVKDEEGNVITPAVPETTISGAIVEKEVKCVSYHPTQLDMLRADAAQMQTSLDEFEQLLTNWVNSYTPEEIESLEQRQAQAWERIKNERDRRKYLGVKVGDHWFHSDDASRIQQLALVMMGQAMTPGLQWKTLTSTPPPVFVTMTPALAMSIFQATALNDQMVFAAAETHRVTMESLSNPEDYDFSNNWPHSFEDELS